MKNKGGDIKMEKEGFSCDIVQNVKTKKKKEWDWNWSTKKTNIGQGQLTVHIVVYKTLTRTYSSITL